MENLGALNLLRIPLQILWEFADVSAKIQTDGSGFRKDLIAWFNKYEPNVQKALRQQLAWAIQHPNYNFQSVLQNVKTSNEGIVRYFAFLYDATGNVLQFNSQ